MQPRIFISSVTAELGTTRQLAANALTRLGYTPVWQDVFGLEAGDLRDVLRQKIDDCDGLVHLVGQAYGAEPPTVDPAVGRVSYTQFELLYAQAQKKRTWIIFAEEGYPPDRPLAELDLPTDPQHADPESYQAERRKLQAAWRKRLRGEGYLWHGADPRTAMELKLEQLRQEFTELRAEFRKWQSHVTTGITSIAENLDNLHPLLIEAQLRKTIDATYQNELAAARQLPDWKRREDIKQAAAEWRDRRLGDVSGFLRSITSTIETGCASAEFLELTRIMQEQGVDEALQYITAQERRLLDRAEQLAVAKQREIRQTLAPLLEAVKLHRSRGEHVVSRTMCDKILAIECNWPESLHESIWIEIDLGDRASSYETTAAAFAHFKAAESIAKRLVTIDGDNPAWHRTLSVTFERLGNMYLRLGRADDALVQCEAGLKIRRFLAEGDPSDSETQRDLSISYEKLGNVYLEFGRTDDALQQYEAGLKISMVLAEKDASSSEKQRDLSISYDRLGNVFFKLGRTDDALQRYKAGLEIRLLLAEKDPSSSERQRDLWVSYNKLGDAFLQLGQSVVGWSHYEAGLRISLFQAERDPNNSEKQRDLSISYEHLGDVFLELGRTDDALQQHEGGLKIRRVLAEKDPSSSEKQRDLMISHAKLGEVLVAQQQFASAIARFEQGIAVLDRLIDRGLLIESAGKEKTILERRIAFCREELKKAKR